MRERGSPLLLAVVAVLLAMSAQDIASASYLADFSAPDTTTTSSTHSTTTTTAATTTTETIPPTTTTTLPSRTATTTTTTVPVVVTTTTTLPAPKPLNRIYRVRHILWPLPGYLDVASSWGAERDGGTRLHAGNDIMAPKMTPVVAVANGTIGAIRNQAGDCCWIVLDHDDGWSSWYLHLNNDILSSDNGRGNGIRPDLVEGMRVAAGEVIGWVGDSGNAEPGPSHLHFELHMPGVGAIDPYPSLRWARNNTGQPAFANAFIGAFNDDDGMRSEVVFEYLTTLGASIKCDSWGAQSCPMLAATTLDAAAWLGAMAGVEIPVLPPPQVVEAGAAQTAATSGSDLGTQTTGPGTASLAPLIAEDPCSSECVLPLPMTRGQLMTMVLWSLRERSFQQAEGFSIPAPPAPWELSPAVALSELQYLGLTDICPLLDLPLDSLVSRGQVAEVIGQAFGLVRPLSCGQVS